MAKKNWIYIKRGLSEDPKHRAAMGECIWLYMHIIDRADWETGIAYDWKDQQEANEMGMPVETLRYQRKKLEENDYIRCSKKQYSQDIRIMEWKNPRDYGSDTKNPRIQSDNLLQPSDFQSHNQSHNQSDNQSDNQLIAQIKTPTLDSKSLSYITESANKTVDAILEGARLGETTNKLKAWKQRNQFTFNEHVVVLADFCVQRFGEPSKKDVTTWVMEIGSWVDAGARSEDWNRAVEIVSQYSQPVISVTGMTKAIKFAAQERKNGVKPPDAQPHPEYQRFQPMDDNLFVPAPKRFARSEQ